MGFIRAGGDNGWEVIHSDSFGSFSELDWGLFVDIGDYHHTHVRKKIST